MGLENLSKDLPVAALNTDMTTPPGSPPRDSTGMSHSTPRAPIIQRNGEETAYIWSRDPDQFSGRPTRVRSWAHATYPRLQVVTSSSCSSRQNMRLGVARYFLSSTVKTSATGCRILCAIGSLLAACVRKRRYGSKRMAAGGVMKMASRSMRAAVFGSFPRLSGSRKQRWP